MLIAHLADFAQVFEFALLVLVLAGDDFLGVQPREEIMGLDLLALGQ